MLPDQRILLGQCVCGKGWDRVDGRGSDDRPRICGRLRRAAISRTDNQRQEGTDMTTTKKV
ncbi:MAG: hypothetical protein ACREMQ_08575, partial [Longimicrobiales bacterium]